MTFPISSPFTLFGNTFRNAFWLIVIAEIFSLIGFIYPTFGGILFILIVFIVFLLSLWRFDYAVLLALCELFIGSKGYLFSWTLHSGERISLRLAIFLIIVLVWFGKFLWMRRAHFFKSTFFPWYILFFGLIALGILRGFVFQNVPKEIFLDVNAYFFFAYAFVLWDTIKTTKYVERATQILAASVLWTGVKTLFTVIVFAQGSEPFLKVLYKWIRETGIGEIAPVQGNLFRVFFQSHVFSMIGFFIFLAIFCVNRKKMRQKDALIMKLLIVATSFSVFLSLSRSFWVGSIVGISWLFFMLRWRENFSIRKLTLLFFSLFVLFALEFSFISILINTQFGGYIARRVSEISEPAASSRMNQLKPLSDAVRKHLLLGSGFGSRVTYITKDPRDLEHSPDGKKTTYAFEWGYLDIALKIGILGLFLYLILITKTLRLALKKIKQEQEDVSRSFSLGLFTACIALVITNIFSPYLNHPLGIGYLLFMQVILTSTSEDIHE